MLEKPDLWEALLLACLRDEYGLRITELSFLPIGADANTAVYRAVGDGAIPYFLKLRGGDFSEAAVNVPWFLSTQGISQVIAPIETRTHARWTHVDRFAVMLYPFVSGRTGFDADLEDHHWVELGAALKGLHSAVIPHEIGQHVPSETYSPYWRERVRMFQSRADDMTFAEPVARELAAFLRFKRVVIDQLVVRAEQLAALLQASPPEHVLCHADIHGWNVLIDQHDALFIVDWDTLIFAPKERDLMFIGGGIGGIWNTPSEEALFYQGYGATKINLPALAYYRFERIVEDIAAYCEQLLLTDAGDSDRPAALRSLADQFLPDNVVEIANATDMRLAAQRAASGRAVDESR